MFDDEETLTHEGELYEKPSYEQIEEWVYDSKYDVPTQHPWVE